MRVDTEVRATRLTQADLTRGATTISSDLLPKLSASFVDRMRLQTRALHVQAERSGVVAALLRGQANRRMYALYLRALLPAYQALESVLQRGDRPLLTPLACPRLYRAPAIETDLRDLAGPDWAAVLQLPESGRRYAERIEAAAADGDGARLIAHCYTRYLGDLNGGQTIGRRVAALRGDGDWTPAFHAFPGIVDPVGFAASYRHALNEAACQAECPHEIVIEARIAFQMNIDLSIEVSTTDG